MGGLSDFLFDSSPGAVLGALAGKLFKDNWDNRSYAKGQKVAEEQRQNTAADFAQADQNLLKAYGHDGLVGQSPGQAIVGSKKKFTDYLEAGNKIKAQREAALAAGNQTLVNQYDQQIQQYEGLKNAAHGQAEMIRSMGAQKGWDLSGFGADDTLDASQQRLKGGAIQSITPNADFMARVNALGQAPEEKPIYSILDTIENKPEWMTGMQGKGAIQSAMPNEELMSRANAFGQELEAKVSAEDILAVLKNDEGAQQMRSDYLKQTLDERTKSPYFLASLESELRKKNVDPDVMQRILSQVQQQQQQTMTNGYIDQMYSDPATANKTALQLTAIGRPDVAGMYSQTNPTPKEAWNVGVGRENAATAQGYTLARMNKTHELGNETADNNIGRQKEISAYAAQLNLKTQGMAMEQKYNFVYQGLKNAGATDQEAAQGAIGLKTNSGNSQQQKQQQEEQKQQLEAAKTMITNYNDYVKQNGSDEGYPLMDQYKQAVGIYGSLLGGGSDAKDYDLGKLDDAWSYVTRGLEENAKNGNPISKEDMITIIRAHAGEYADHIIENTDWGKWGYDVKPTRGDTTGQIIRDRYVGGEQNPGSLQSMPTPISASEMPATEEVTEKPSLFKILGDSVMKYNPVTQSMEVWRKAKNGEYQRQS